ncbi:leukocyte elastase inhibitor-like [Dermacentor andersoni]|uniref:leukocyte elastase inhibitor-like n=1 Tax=Dermacentor andersoni TaxID=34620 RepID=UPI0021555E49|nr:leukocyte elastase inhibitor-like [Dermacentor andersoni]XP_054931262.1 leukocyte elastase inhibitor-like [Dermacentor andersoni]XP_054931263.1 leukocyte elastase inhibitor-like [Dermacentor andersoni]XP_054931264.1 leukocyte elastase inhibitor-like [Dermacentor andersoni]
MAPRAATISNCSGVRKTTALAPALRAAFYVALLALTCVQPADAQQGLPFGTRKLAFSANQFGLDLYRALRDAGAESRQPQAEGNVALCPFCVSSSLGMLLLGARGSSAMALRHVLYLWGMQHVHLAVRDLSAHLAHNLRDANLLIFRSLYVQRDFGVKYPFQRSLYHFYNASVHSLDFAANAEEARQHINAVVEKASHAQLANLLPDTPPPWTQLLLLSGLHLDSHIELDLVPAEGVRWKAQPLLDPVPPTLLQLGRRADTASLEDTTAAAAEVIESLGGNPAMLEARWTRVRYARHDYLNCTAVEVPLAGGGLVSLLTLTPNQHDDMGLLETRLSAQRISDILGDMHVRRANVKLPRIKIEHSHENLTQSLARMGLASLFGPGRAQLFDMSDVPWLHVTNVVHKTSLDIKGPRATVAGGGGQVAPPPPKPSNRRREPAFVGPSEETIDIVLDRPFLYFVVDNVSGLVIAMGKVLNP